MRALVLLAVSAAATAPLATLGGLAPVAHSDGIVFAVPAGAEIEKTFTVEHQLVAQKIQLEGKTEGLLAQQGLEVSSKIDLSVLDACNKVEGGRPLETRRLFKNCAMHVELSSTDARGGKRLDTADADTPLQGKSAVFTWIPEEKTYGRYYDQSETLEEYLAGLSEDMDLRCLLPDSAIRAGGTWTIDAARLVDLFAAGGDVPLGFTQGGGGTFAQVLISGVGGLLYPEFGGTVKGDVSAKWTETREATLESAGSRFAVVELKVEIETDHDLSDAAGLPASGEKNVDAQTVARSNIHWKFVGTGTLIWNLGAGRFETFDLVGREEVTSDLTMDLAGERSRQVLTMAGSLKLSAKASPKKK